MPPADLAPVAELRSKDERFRLLKEKGLLIDIDRIDQYLKRFGGKSASPARTYWAGKRILITGAEGMVGSTITDILIGLGSEVTGTVRRHASADRRNLRSHIEGGDAKFRLVEIDLRDSQAVSGLMTDVRPHVVFHQASESFVPTSISQPAHVTENNCVSTVNILEAARKADELDAVQLACSSEQLGFVSKLEELPIAENADLRPTSTYAATKVFTEYIGLAYNYMYGIPSVITRTFNQEGPRRPPQFFTGGVASQIAAIQRGAADKMVIGNPNSVRDFTHILDSSAAQVLAVEKCQRATPYHLCSGSGILMGDYAELALRTFGLEKKITVMVDRSRLRPYEQNKFIDGFIGDNRKFVEATGWHPTKSVVDIIKDGVAFYAKGGPGHDGRSG